MEIWRAGVPEWNTISGCRLSDVIVTNGRTCELQPFDDSAFGWCSRNRELLVRKLAEEFDLFRESKNGPRQPTRPSGEWRVSLLRIHTSETSVVAIEDGLMRHSASILGRVKPIS